MDVQTENMDPPPCESQSSGKIRKGFKLFGKRKPGNIFSIRSKGDGNNKSPVNRSKTLDGLLESAAPDSEQEPDKEKGHEVSQGEMEQAEEETLGEDGVLAAAQARTSISSASSAKSLSFLSLLRGGRRGTGDRRVHTVSQPVGRQRRSLKGLFGNVKFLSKDKDDKEEPPPSPLLMSSRANSVEIIKEDLTLTPKSQPRSLDSPETESGEPIKSLTTPDSADTTPSENVTPLMTAGNVSRTNEHVPLLPTPELPLVPGDTSLSCLLADISSLLTFDSISGGGDIMADVEAEWGKASSAISAVVTEVTPSSTSLFSKPSVSSPLTSLSVSTAAMAKPSPVAIPTAASTKSFTPVTPTTSSSSPMKPSTIITTFTKSSTLTTHSVKLSSESTSVSEPFASIKMKSSPIPATGKHSTTPVTTTSLSSTITSSPSTAKSTLSSTSTTNTAPPNTPATAVKAPSISPVLTSTVCKLASEVAASPQTIPAANKSGPVATSPPAPAKPPPVTHSPPTLVSFTQPPTPKLDSASNLNLQTSTSYKPAQSSAAGEPKAPTTTVPTKPPSPAPVISSKTTAVSISTTTSASVSAALSKPMLPASPIDLNQTLPSFAAAPHICTSSTSTTITKTQPSPAPVPAPSSLDEILPVTKPAPAPVSSDKTPPASTKTAVVSTASSVPPSLGQVPVSQCKTLPEIPTSLSKVPPAQMQDLQTKAPPAPAQIPVPMSKTPPAPAQIPVPMSKTPTAPAQIPVPMSKTPPAPAQIPVSLSKTPPAPAQIPVSVSKTPPAPAQIPISVTKDCPVTAQIPDSVSKSLPPPEQIPISVSKHPSAPAQIPVSLSSTPPAPAQIPVSLPKDSPAPAHIPVSQSKAPPAPTSAPAPCTVTSLPTPTAPLSSEASASAKMRGTGQTSVDGQLTSPCSTCPQDTQTMPFKTDEQQNESRTSLQGPSRERRTPQVKSSGLSKIPVVGGGRAVKLPVRESQHADDEACRDPPTPVLEEERPHFNSHDAGRKDKISVVVPTSKHTQEESQQPPQPKVLTSLPRDSKIPVKHGTQPHTASQIPQAKEPPRTKIPVSKVPVRRVGNKPAAAGTQTRK